MKSLLASICLLACANRASSLSITPKGVMTDENSQRDQAKEQAREQSGGKSNPQTASARRPHSVLLKMT